MVHLVCAGCKTVDGNTFCRAMVNVRDSLKYPPHYYFSMILKVVGPPLSFGEAGNIQQMADHSGYTNVEFTPEVIDSFKTIKEGKIYKLRYVQSGDNGIIVDKNTKIVECTSTETIEKYSDVQKYCE